MGIDDTGMKTEPHTSDIASTTCAPTLAQSLTPQPKVIPNGLIVISQATWYEAMKRSATLETNV